MEDEDFLAAVEADNAGTPVEDQKPEPETVKAEEKSAEPTVTAEAPNAEVLELTTDEIVQPKPSEADGRLLALLEERDKRKAAEAELERFRAAQQPQQQPERPDEYEDPDGARAYDQAERQREMYAMRLQFSERVAKIEHGAEKVEAAKTWAAQKADQDPLFNAKALQSDDPIGFAISEYQREEIASKVSLDDFAQFQAWKAAQGQLQQTQQGQAPPPNQTSAIPPKSLASAPSAGSILTEPVQTDEEMFDEVIPRR